MRAAIGLVVFILVLPFIVNIPDAKLLDEARNIIVSPPQPLSPQEGNGFYALLGFEAPKGKDIYEVGKDAFAAYVRSQSGKTPSFEFSLREMMAPSPKMPAPDFIPNCVPEKGECLRYYSENEVPMLRLLEENELLLGRYRSLKKYAYFRDITKPAPWAPQIKVERGIFAGHLLAAGQAAILYRKGSREEAFRLLAGDIGLWRKLLAGASDLPCKTYSLLALRLDYSLLSEMVDKISKDKVKAASMIPDELLASLSVEERSTSMVWDNQFRALAWSLSNNRWPVEPGHDAKMSFLERFFCKSNATLNEAYGMFHLLKDMSTVDPAEAENLGEAFSRRLGQKAKLSPYQLYNPLGKRFISSSFDDRTGVYWNRSIHSLDQLISQIRGKAKS